MKPKEAKDHLIANLSAKHDLVNTTQLASIGWYLSAHHDEEEATLDGEFTADDLEAIAMWMRDPIGIMTSGDSKENE